MPEPTSTPSHTPAARAGGAVLSSGVSINGSLKFRDELVIDCKLEGSIDSTGRLTIGKNAQVQGEVRVGSAIVHGSVEGDITATERCELRAGCALRGDIEAPRLVVDDEATFIGSAKITTPQRQPAAS